MTLPGHDVLLGVLIVNGIHLQHPVYTGFEYGHMRASLLQTIALAGSTPAAGADD